MADGAATTTRREPSALKKAVRELESLQARRAAALAKCREIEQQIEAQQQRLVALASGGNA